jgi:guanylate kinase
MEGVTVSISHTTRPKRPDEIHGTNYYFIDKPEFKSMIDNHDFLEHATIFENWYGTSKSWVKQTLEKGMDVILEIDWQGHQQIKQLFPGSIGIFILPPSLETLKHRLVNRKQDNEEVIEKRLADARDTISHANEFDYLVINDEFEHALHSLRIIVEAGRLLQKRQSAKYAKLLGDLLR